METSGGDRSAGSGRGAPCLPGFGRRPRSGMKGASLILNVVGMGAAIWLVRSIAKGDPTAIASVAFVGILLYAVGWSARFNKAGLRARSRAERDRAAAPPAPGERATRPALSAEWVKIEWVSLGLARLDSSGKLSLPRAPAMPGVYRFAVRGDSCRADYIGEAADLRRRFNGYRNPGPSQHTNIRVSDRLCRALGAGQRVEVALVAANAVDRRGSVGQLSIESAIVRRELERGLVSAMRRAGRDVINR